MSGTTAPKIASFACTNGAAVPTGTTLGFRWTAYPASAGATEIQLQGSNDSGAIWQRWHSVGPSATAVTKGGCPDGAWQFRVVARKSTGDIAGSTSDAVAVRLGPAPATQPAPTYATASDLAALASRLDAVAARVGAIEAAGLPAKFDALAARVSALETANAARVAPADLRRVGASTAADELLAVRGGEIVVVTKG